MFRLIIEYKYKQDDYDPPRTKVFTGQKLGRHFSQALMYFVFNGKVAWFRITSIYDGN